MSNKLRHTIIFITLICITSCNLKNKTDPLQPYNKFMFRINKGIDRAILKPIASGYKQITPSKIQYCISNVLSNLGESTNLINHLLQGKVFSAGTDFWRFVINSTVGLAGMIDVAKHIGLHYEKETFGQTLRVWGIKNPTYIVLPILGPSSTIDGIGIVADIFFNPITYVNDNTVKVTYYTSNAISIRSNLDEAYAIIDTSINPYITQKNMYLQYKNKQPANKQEQTDDFLEDLE